MDNMPRDLWVRGMPKTDPTTFIVDPANYYGDELNTKYTNTAQVIEALEGLKINKLCEPESFEDKNIRCAINDTADAAIKIVRGE